VDFRGKAFQAHACTTATAIGAAVAAAQQSARSRSYNQLYALDVKIFEDVKH
jgi:hypothetical protein